MCRSLWLITVAKYNKKLFLFIFNFIKNGYYNRKKLLWVVKIVLKLFHYKWRNRSLEKF